MQPSRLRSRTASLAVLASCVVAALAARPASAACEVPLPGDTGDLDEFACGAINPPQNTGTAGNVPKLVVWTGGYDVNPLGGMRGGIYLARIDGTGRRKITTFSNPKRDFEEHGLNLPDDHPSFSPDNRKLVFTSNRFDEDDWDIFVMNVNGSSPTRISAAAGLDTEPVFSPDGSRIAFATERFNGSLDIATMKTNGTDVKRITTSAFDEIEPAWRPDGQELVFSRVTGSGEKDVFVVKPDGTGLRQVTFTAGEDHDATYSPDGTRLVLTTERPPFNPPYGSIHVIRVSDGVSLANLTADLRLGAGDPFWSRDGSLIAYFHSLTRLLKSPQRVFVMNASGGGKFHIPGENPVNVHPAIGLAIDDDGDGTPNYLESGSVGDAAFTPASVTAGRWETVSLRWRHPEAWRSIDRLGVRFADKRHLLGAIYHQVEDESFSLFDGEDEEETEARLLGRGIVRVSAPGTRPRPLADRQRRPADDRARPGGTLLDERHRQGAARARRGERRGGQLPGRGAGTARRARPGRAPRTRAHRAPGGAHAAPTGGGRRSRRRRRLSRMDPTEPIRREDPPGRRSRLERPPPPGP